MIVCLTQQVSGAEQEMTFGVHPFKIPSKLQKMFTPIIRHLEQELGVKIVFKRSKTYDEK